jgi:orotidine-5'-phosphate decarboxylase
MPHESRPAHAADRLLAAIDRLAAPVCVGLDPVLERLPASLRPQQADIQGAVDAIATFTRGVLDAVHAHVPCVKFQSACFERYGWQGVRALQELIIHAGQCGLEVILDAKRGDIGISAEHYAAAAFEGPSSADWLTINAYLGADGIEPFLRGSCGAFALVRTSNPGGDALQSRNLADGATIADAVAAIVAEIGSKHVGERGYSALGAVVGATKPVDAERLRQAMPQQIFLVPGYGAQGGGVADILPCFRDGEGAIITASRSVIYGFDKNESNWQRAVSDAAARLADEIGSAVDQR